MKHKNDWPEAQRRLTALWHHERLDRPCIAVRAPQAVVNPTPVPEPANDEVRWLDPTYRVALAHRELDPALLMLDTWAASPAEGERLLAQCVAWTRAGKGNPR